MYKGATKLNKYIRDGNTYNEIIPKKYGNWKIYELSSFLAYLLMAYKNYSFPLDEDNSFIYILDECC